MSKTTDNFSFIDEIKHQLYLYRVKCDIALSDREEGVITQAEYHRAIERQGEINADVIIKNFEKLMLEVEVKAKISILKEIEPPEQWEQFAIMSGKNHCSICGFNAIKFRDFIEERIKALESMLSKPKGDES